MNQTTTPPDCDLRGMPFMPLDIVRLIDSDLFAKSTGEEFKAAVALWCKSWQQLPAGSLPDDDQVLAHLSSTGSRWAKVKAMALRGWFTAADGRLYHPVVVQKALEAWDHRLKQRAKANRRWGKEPEQAPDNDVPPRSSAPRGGIAAAVPEQSPGNAAASAAAMQGTVKLSKKESPPPAVVPPQLRGSRLPTDWHPGAEGRAMAANLGLNPDAVLAKFRDHWIAKAGKDGAKLDWAATWRNWCRSDAERAAKFGRPQRKAGLEAAYEAVGLFTQPPNEPYLDGEIVH